MTRTEAIKTAATLVSISGRGTSWTIHGPYHCSEPHGARTVSRADSYAQAVRIRTGWRARIALALMGKLDDATSSAVEHALHDEYGPHDLNTIMRDALGGV